MTTPSVYNGLSFTEKDLIESIVSNFYFIDYGFVSAVNGDKTINVTHAKFLTSATGEQLEATITKNIEVLTFATKGISINFEIKQGDKVLLLGLKNRVEKTQDVTIATQQNTPIHYCRDTLKAIPFGVFDSTAKIQIDFSKGINVKSDEAIIIDASGKNIELNGNTKSFVTYAELNQALQSLWTSIQTHTHIVATTGTAAAQSGTASPSVELSTAVLNISAAETKTIKTGG